MRHEIATHARLSLARYTVTAPPCRLSGSTVGQPRTRVHCCSVQASERHERHPYVSSDGRPKSTMEEAFRLDRRMEKAPWRFSWQKNERSLVFDDPLKVQLVKGFAAKELGLSAEVSVKYAA